ncbi:MAG: hypothetical protein PHO71_17375 [Bacteroides sp.]|nr:hypothetical protein [Bacteroides sp.]
MVKETVAWETKFGTLAHSFDEAKAIELQELVVRRICTCCGEREAYEDLDMCTVCAGRVQDMWKGMDAMMAAYNGYSSLDKRDLCRHTWETKRQYAQRVSGYKESNIAPEIAWNMQWDPNEQVYKHKRTGEIIDIKD